MRCPSGDSGAGNALFLLKVKEATTLCIRAFTGRKKQEIEGNTFNAAPGGNKL